MIVRWTEEAAEQLRNIVAYISRNSAESARRFARHIYEQVSGLQTMPHRGRQGSEPGTRDLVLDRFPYIVTYEVLGEAVFILRIRHAAQDWPLR